MPIICLSGWKFSGKDSVANYLVKNYNGVRIALADPLKNMVAEEYGIDRQSMDDPKIKESPILHLPVIANDGFTQNLAAYMWKEFRTEKGEVYKPKGLFSPYARFNGILIEPTEQLYHTPRSLCILKGSGNRLVDPKYWTNKAFQNIGEALQSRKLPVITDLRFKTEVADFKNQFSAQTVFVRINRYDTSPSSDASERDLDDHKFDYHIDNRGTLEQTFEQVGKMLGSI